MRERQRNTHTRHIHENQLTVFNLSCGNILISFFVLRGGFIVVVLPQGGRWWQWGRGGGGETTPQHTRSEHIFRSISLASARINASESAHIFHILFAQSEEERRERDGGGVGRTGTGGGNRSKHFVSAIKVCV